jgi:NSS family neurotransmitter:Na+ symporter
MENSNSSKREKFSSGLAVFFATLSSAVGLGNLWKFPTLVGTNGGGAFILTYLICVLIVGMPIMIAEFYIGRRTRSNAVGAFDKLKAHGFWKVIGYAGVLSAFLIMFFYTAVAGWVYSYIYKTLKGDFNILKSTSTEEALKIASDKFSLTASGDFSPIFWQSLVIIIVAIILIAGVRKGIERFTKALMPILFFLILICAIRAITLPKASEGLKFLFSVDFSQINKDVILSALGLAFFKLSLGMGTMITYGSYFTEDNNLIATSGKVALSDTLVSLLAGIAIFPVVFEYGMTPSAGPSLLFNTIPLVFSRMTMGNILLIAFFILASVAATTAIMSMMEVPVAFLTEELKMKRSNSVILCSFLILLVGAITVHPSSLFGNITLFDKSFFDLFDFLSSNVLLPLGGLLISLFIGYAMPKSTVIEELTNKGALNTRKLEHIFYFIIRYITPLLLFIVFLHSIGLLDILFGYLF